MVLSQKAIWSVVKSPKIIEMTKISNIINKHVSHDKNEMRQNISFI